MFKGMNSPAKEVGSSVSFASGERAFSDTQHSALAALHLNIQCDAHDRNTLLVMEKVAQDTASTVADSSFESATKVPILTSSPGRVLRKLDNMGQ